MSINAFTENLAKFDDAELLKIAKKYVACERAHDDFSARRADAVYRECEKRSIKLFSSAMDEAYCAKSPFRQTGLARALDIKYFDKLGRADLQTISSLFPHSSALNFISQYGINRPGMFFGTVDGVSMIGAKLFHGDIIICDARAEFIDGAIILAKIEDEIFIKRLKIIDGAYYLYSENPDFAPVALTQEFDYSFLGVVKFAIREVQ